MPHRHYPPAYLRYIKARLWNLGKPSFWGTAIFLSVVGLAILKYWSNPNFTDKQNNQVTSTQPKDPSLTAEDKAIAADIDNLPALYSDLEDINLPAITSTSPEKSQAKKSQGFLQDVISKQLSSNSAKPNSDLGTVNNASAPKKQNPFVSQTENLLRFGTLENGNQFSGVKSLNTSSELTNTAGTSSRLGIETDKSENSSSISPLQSSLNQSSNQSISNFNGVNSTQTNSLGQTYYGGGVQTSPSNILPSQTLAPTNGLNNGTGYIQPTVPNATPNPYNNLNNAQALPNQTFSPTTRLNNGTGYIQPTVPNPTPNSYNNLNNAQALPNQTFSPTPRLNTGTGYTQPAVTNPTSNPYNNLNSNQTLPSQTRQSSGIPFVNSVTPTNVAPYSIQAPNSNAVTPTTPVVPGTSDNFSWQQPTQVPQSNLSVPRQIPGQYKDGVQNNGYSYP
ncbi:hypothetical protein I8751_16545 [Nostocaceae cyanobacterium CENA357]|uniref:Uncharacterized protein n=1 Tax=Atlanticothrix silvestris CENA357 TaxID=1725252 RepID=A0A8J7HFC6_9CYAN|nr:hypothetical protein [Atlanticothrix silvestris]MBH8553951.1 hypothetical protein [Atlanticothrix silvestris CENA357]